MSYQVGIDFGSVGSTAAVCRSGRAEILPLVLPSVLFADRDGSWRYGDEAEARAAADPSRVARRFKDRIGDGIPILIGGAGGMSVPAEVLAARVVGRVLDLAAERMGGRASQVAVAHPVGWGRHRLESLRGALAAAGLHDPLLVSEPHAAVLAQPRSAPGIVAVHDLGAAGFTATVLRKTTHGNLAVLGATEELDFGGLDLDEAVFTQVTGTLGAAWDRLDALDPATLAAVARLRRECADAKERLSADTEVLIPVRLPGIHTRVRLTRAELEELIRPAVEQTAAVLHRVVRSAGFGPDDLVAVVLTGGSARIPLVTQVVSAELGRPVSTGDDPKAAVAVGAALAARDFEGEQTRMLPVVEPAPRPSPRPPLAPRAKKSAGRRRLVPVAAGVAGAALLVAAAVGFAVVPDSAAPASADPNPPRPTTTSDVVPASETEADPPSTELPPTTTAPQRTRAPRPSSSPVTVTTTPEPTSTTTTDPPVTTTPQPTTDVQPTATTTATTATTTAAVVSTGGTP